MLWISILLFQPLFQRVLGNPDYKDETHGTFCEASSSTLSWYLNGIKQDVGLGREPPFLLPVAPGSSSTLSLEEIVGENCNQTENQGEELLNIHFPPDSPVRKPHVSGLSLLLLLVIQTRPPSSFTIRDQDGQQFVNSSRLLLLDTRNVEGNGSLRVKISTGQSDGSQTPVTAMGLLSTRVEIPLLVLIVAGSALAAGILLVNILVWCLVLKRKKEKYGVENRLTLSISNNMKLNNICLPREHMSLPSNLQLNDLRPQARGPGDSECDTQEDVSVPCGALNDTGLDRYPLVGYIYRASSVSSDEIWL
ncbi:transmembrane protein 25 [Pseudophryne corroboree]|uniref:transmembrane protein 25 n=1 Tax=Pseudophryne corroboree TaxID=495146 RepID=UPI003081BE1C